MSIVKPSADDVAYALKIKAQFGSRKVASQVMHVSQSVLRDIEVGRDVQSASLHAFRKEKARLMAKESIDGGEAGGA